LFLLKFFIILTSYYFDREGLEESSAFSKRELAALVVSKVYFHLGSYLDSLNYALRTGSLLSKDPNALYIDTIKGGETIPIVTSMFYFIVILVLKCYSCISYKIQF